MFFYVKPNTIVICYNNIIITYFNNEITINSYNIDNRLLKNEFFLTEKNKEHF